MKQETYVKARSLNNEIEGAEHIVEVLKRKQPLYICHEIQGEIFRWYVSEELKKRILSTCEEYLKETEKEFEEL